MSEQKKSPEKVKNVQPKEIQVQEKPKKNYQIGRIVFWAVIQLIIVAAILFVVLK